MCSLVWLYVDALTLIIKISQDSGAHEVWRLESGAVVLRRPEPLPRAAAGVGAAVVGHAAVHRRSGR